MARKQKSSKNKSEIQATLTASSNGTAPEVVPMEASLAKESADEADVKQSPANNGESTLNVNVDEKTEASEIVSDFPIDTHLDPDSSNSEIIFRNQNSTEHFSTEAVSSSHVGGDRANSPPFVLDAEGFENAFTIIQNNQTTQLQSPEDPSSSADGSKDLLLRSHEEQTRLRALLEDLQSRFDKLQSEKSQSEAQYKSLFGKVTQMKTTLGARLKQDSEELAQNRTVIEEFEIQNTTLNETINHMQAQVVEAVEASSMATRELANKEAQLITLNTRLYEAESLVELERSLHKKVLDEHIMGAAEWENLAIEERSARDTLRDRIHELEEQLSAQNTAYDNLRNIVHQDDQAITKFKQNIIELQDSHKLELRETAEALQSRIDQLTVDHESAEERTSKLRTEVQNLNMDLEKLRPYESEVKEKNLLIGKLRHEAVILNEHLTKALRLLKRGSSNDSVDRQLLNNLLLSFFQLPRQDSKRFEILRILASVLAWDETQREQAGLLRPGTSLTSFSTQSPPISPLHARGSSLSRRASGNLQLQAADFIGPNRESMSDLWINFLESEAAMEAAEQRSGS